MVTWTEPTSSTDAIIVEINDENNRPGNHFPIGFTRIEYTLRNPETGDVSYCAFYVHVLGESWVSYIRYLLK